MEDEINEPVPQKVVIDIDAAIEAALEKRAVGINAVCILTDSAGARVELQSSTESLGALLGSAHDSLAKIRAANGTKRPAPGVS